MKAPGQIRSRGSLTYSHPRISESGEEDLVVQYRDAGAGLVEVVHQAAEYSAAEGLT
jgi:hypothetical protein